MHLHNSLVVNSRLTLNPVTGYLTCWLSKGGTRLARLAPHNLAHFLRLALKP